MAGPFRNEVITIQVSLSQMIVGSLLLIATIPSAVALTWVLRGWRDRLTATEAVVADLAERVPEAERKIRLLQDLDRPWLVPEDQLIPKP